MATANIEESTNCEHAIILGCVATLSQDTYILHNISYNVQSLYALVFTAVAYLALLGVCLPVVIGPGIVLYCYRKKCKTPNHN